MAQAQSQPSSSPTKLERTVEGATISRNADSRNPEPAEPETVEADEGQRLGTSYLERPTKEQCWQRWREIQTDFVDDPRRAVAEAHRMVGELIQDIVHRFESERAELERRWSSGDGVSTEDLRGSLQRYRDFFGRLLAMDDHD